MARPSKQNDLDQKIADILASMAPQIAVAVREHLALLFGGGGAAAPARATTTKRAAAAKPKKYNNPVHCIAPGCTKKHGGPRSGFFCVDHQKLSKGKKTEIKAARKAPSGDGGASKRKITKKSAAPAKEKAKRKISAAGRKKMSEAAKARWAAKAKAGKKD